LIVAGLGFQCLLLDPLSGDLLALLEDLLKVASSKVLLGLLIWRKLG